jgi:hypothetical protein
VDIGVSGIGVSIDVDIVASIAASIAAGDRDSGCKFETKNALSSARMAPGAAIPVS